MRLWNVQEWRNKRHISTLEWAKPYALAKFLAHMARIDLKYPKGTYFKIVPN